jgi:signal transduction histidine kinase/DNA-binding response OmpR family regulator
MPQQLRRLARLVRHAVALTAFVLSCLTGAAALAATDHPLAKAGVLDLLSGNAAAAVQPLHGEWGFDWERFVDPASDAPLPALAPVPGLWNGLTVDGKQRGPDGFGSYSLEVRCPAGRQMALSVSPQRTAMQLFVNGKLVAAQGTPGMSAESAQPAIGRRAVLTESFPCPLRVTMHLSNFSHRAGGVIRTPVAGPIELLAPQSQQRLALDTILLGAYLVLGISPLSFYLVRRKEKAPLVFGLYCLAQTVYADMTGERLLLQLWAGPETSWEVFLRTEYFAWFSAMALFTLLVQQLFLRAMNRTVVRALVAACLVGLLFVAVTPARVYSQFVVYGQLVGVAIGLYVLVSLARAARQGRPDAVVILSGMAFLGLVLLSNLAPFSGDMAQRGISAFGLLAFVLSPAIVLLRRLGRALNVEESRSAEQREKVDMLVRATQAGILDWDYTRNLTGYSPRLLEIMGYPPDTDTTDWPVFFERVHPADRPLIQDTFIHQLRDRSVRSGEMKHEPHEYRLLRRDGSGVWVHAEAISLRAPDGRTLRYICSFLDVTDQRAVAEGLKRQNAALAENARLREDVERMSRHDLKTPLNSIIGVSRLLREDPAVQPEHRELLTIAERAGYRMLEMVNRSLDLSRMELGTYDFHPQAVDVVDVIERVVLDLQGLAEAANVRVKIEHAFSTPVYARAEELLCYSILANLVKNAVEATPPDGVVAISLAVGEPLRVAVRNPGRVLPAIAPRFFDKYVTAGKSGGTGLGTYSARLMARVQEGDLEMRTGDTGTVVKLTLRALGTEALPIARRPQLSTGTAARAPLGGADFASRRVLVVDDDEYNRLLLLRYLPTPPFTVETAANGHAATETVLRAWPDIVLIDLEMPVMDGIEAVAWIRAREVQEGRKPCLIVMMSSNDDAVSIRRGLAAGSNRYLTKPFSRESLLAVLHALDTGSDLRVPLELEPTRTSHVEPVAADAPVHVDTELLQEVAAFLHSRRQMVEDMASALAAGNRNGLRTVAHRAAGGLALFGFQWAAWQSRQISAAASEGEAGVLSQGIVRLREHLRDVQVV